MPAEDDYDLCKEFAERLGLDEKEADSFVSSSMKRLGYKSRTAWDDPDPSEGEEEEESGDFFSGKRKEKEQSGSGRQQRQVGGRKEASGGGGGWQYED